MSDFNSLVQYTVESISQPIKYSIHKLVESGGISRMAKYIIYKLTEFIRVVDKFIFRQVPSGAASGYATIEQIGGNTVVFNQLCKHTLINWKAKNKLDYDSDTDIIAAKSTASRVLFQANELPPLIGHIFYVSLEYKASTSITFACYSIPSANTAIFFGTLSARNSFARVARIATRLTTAAPTENWALSMYKNQSNTGLEIKLGSIFLADLTAIFGAGNEPTTVADFEAWVEQNIGTLPYYDYNARELLSVKMESVKSIGFNQWDEEWELGSIDNNGQPTTAQEYQNRIRAKNFIPCFPNTIYYAKNGGSGSLSFFFYDADKNFISSTLANNTTFTTPTGCYYMKFRSTAAYGTTYNNNICININDPSKNGTYEPYKTDSADIDVTTITGINTATNVREVIFPNGMKQADYAGTVKDEIDLMNDTATVNVGSRAYQSGDESDTTVITDGTTTYYALTTPIEYTDLQDGNGNPLNPRYKVEQGGTEQVLPANTSTPTTVAPTLTTTYTKDNN